MLRKRYHSINTKTGEYYMPSFVKYTRIFLGFLLVKKFNISRDVPILAARMY